MTDMKKILTYIAVAAVLLAGCKGGETRKKTEMGPEEVVEAFTRHIAAGKFEQALGFCDPTSMQAYIDQCITAWERLENKDSSVLSIASSLLESTEFKVEKTEKTDYKRRADKTKLFAYYGENKIVIRLGQIEILLS